MGWVQYSFLLFCCIFLLTGFCSSHPLCTNLRAPFTLNTSLAFCGYSGSSCCNATDDLALQKQFNATNVSAAGCAPLLKSILCSKCDTFSAELYRDESVPQVVPVLCNSTVSANSSQLGAVDFCSKFWDGCSNVTISNSPFPSLHKAGMSSNFSSRLADSWQSKTAFCNAFGGASDDDSSKWGNYYPLRIVSNFPSGAVCFNGGPVTLNSSEVPSPPGGLCLEKIGNGSYLNMVPHPDGSNRVFLSNQPGKIWLATIPVEGSGEMLGVDESNPYLDLTDEVTFDMEFGMLGIAFHPNFQRNGRFFVSFNCDKVKWSGCGGRCSCNSNVGCDPSTLPPDNGAQPCQYQSVIAEFTANGTSSQPSPVTKVRPQEVRRIFTMGLPFTSHHAGQILFGPEDGYLYFMMGDGGKDDPLNFAQNKNSLLGKIMRFDIDNIPSARVIRDLGLWGNYSVPIDNPFAADNNSAPEIWALGFRNPWRCSFDADRPSYFLCADVGQDDYEEVDLVTKGGNYGCRVYEGPFLINPPSPAGGNRSNSSMNLIFPVLGYSHSEVNNGMGSASITGGYFYRSQTDPCLYGKYLYADFYGGMIWAGTETPEGSGKFSPSKLSFSCARDSPIPCTLEAGVPALQYIFSFGQDNRKDTFILASSGVYRVAPPSRCNYVCSKENVTTSGSGSSSPSPSPSSSSATDPRIQWLLLFFSSLLLLLSSQCNL